MRLQFLGRGPSRPAADRQVLAASAGEPAALPSSLSKRMPTKLSTVPPASLLARAVAAVGAAGEAGAGGEEAAEEEDQWAQEQIRKGMGGLLRPEAAPAAGGRASAGAAAAGAGAAGVWLPSAPGYPLDQQLLLQQQQAAAAAAAAGGRGGAGAATASQAAAVAAAAAEVLKSLQAGVARLQTSQVSAVQQASHACFSGGPAAVGILLVASLLCRAGGPYRTL